MSSCTITSERELIGIGWFKENYDKVCGDIEKKLNVSRDFSIKVFTLAANVGVNMAVSNFIPKGLLKTAILGTIAGDIDMDMHGIEIFDVDLYISIWGKSPYATVWVKPGTQRSYYRETLDRKRFKSIPFSLKISGINEVHVEIDCVFKEF